MARDRHDVVARHHQRFADAGAIVAALFEHFGELRPGFRRRMLAAEFAFAVAPAAIRDHGGDARVGAAGIDADRAAKARADHADTVRIDGRMLGQEIERVAGVLDLFEADDSAEVAFALAAAAHVEAQRDKTEFIEHPRRRDAGRAFAVGAETVQHQERRAPLACPHAVRHAEHSMQAQTRRLKAHDVLTHGGSFSLRGFRGRHSTDLREGGKGTAPTPDQSASH